MFLAILICGRRGSKPSQTSAPTATRNEVHHAIANPGTSVLAIVSSISVADGPEPKAAGGVLALHQPWIIQETALQPLAFSYDVPAQVSLESA